MRAEDLKCFLFESWEKEWVIAKEKKEAIEYYESIIDDEIEEYDIQEIEEWHDLKLSIETRKGYEEITFLEGVKEVYNEETFEPFILASTCY